MTQRLAPALLAAGLLAASLLANAAPPPRPRDLGAVAAKPKANKGLAPDWWRGPFMEIFVRAYQDSDGDGVGDLRGLIQRLDHLKELGVTGIWLMPVTASQDRDHGYATTDFRAIERDYGTMADFDELLRQAHARGIGVIIDYVVNHGSWAHPLFLQAKNSKSNRYRDWFVWSEAAPDKAWDIWGKFPWYWTGAQPWTWTGEVKDMPLAPPGSRDFYFGTFGPHMPDFNLSNPAVVRWHEDNLRFWLNRGLDGFRLDAVPHLVETDAKDWNDQPESRRLTKQFVDLIHRYPKRFAVCEATAKPADYSRPEVCGSAFAFGLERAIMDALKGGKPEAVQQIADFFKERPHSMSTMLANHDIFAGQRIWDQVQGIEAKYKLAAASYLLQPGIPFVYYGEEIGQAGLLELPGDGPIRGPMSWTADGGFSKSAKPYRPLSPNRSTHNAAAQRADAGSLFHHYRQLIALRRAHQALSQGSYEEVQVDGPLLSFVRRHGDERLRVWLNYSDQALAIAAPGELLWAAPRPDQGWLLPAWGVRVERMR
jgi:alpha-amylase